MLLTTGKKFPIEHIYFDVYSKNIWLTSLRYENPSEITSNFNFNLI